MVTEIPEKSAWCYNCLVGEGNCAHHPDGENYTGDKVYTPSKLVLQIVGSYYTGYDAQIFECVGYDPRKGFLMQDVYDPQDLRPVSEQALNRTFHLRQPKYLEVCIMNSVGVPKEAVRQFKALVKRASKVQVFSATHNRMVGNAFDYKLKNGEIWATLELDTLFEEFNGIAGVVSYENGMLQLKGVVINTG